MQTRTGTDITHTHTPAAPAPQTNLLLRTKQHPASESAPRNASCRHTQHSGRASEVRPSTLTALRRAPRCSLRRCCSLRSPPLILCRRGTRRAAQPPARLRMPRSLPNKRTCLSVLFLGHYYCSRTWSPNRGSPPAFHAFFWRLQQYRSLGWNGSTGMDPL